MTRNYQHHGETLFTVELQIISNFYTLFLRQFLDEIYESACLNAIANGNN